MALFNSKKFDNLQDLFLDQACDLYDAEHQLTKALPKLEKAADCAELKAAFRDHLRETANHVIRLEAIFERLGQDPKRTPCDGMAGLVKEGDAIVAAKGDGAVKDAALIAAAQRVEHYEIAGYGVLRSFARRLGFDDLAASLEQTLDEERGADKRLTQIAEEQVNLEAQRA
jgi:ferritin-like metal-binding protein YciE